MRNSIRRDKRSYTDSVATETEEAERHGDRKKLYSMSKKLSGEFSKPDRLVKDKEGETLMGEERQW